MIQLWPFKELLSSFISYSVLNCAAKNRDGPNSHKPFWVFGHLFTQRCQ